MRVAVASSGTLRHILAVDLEGFPAGTRGLCDAPVNIEITKHTQRSIREMKICPACLDLWIQHLKSVKSLTGEKADRNLKKLPHESRMARLAIKPLGALAGRFGRRRTKRS